MKGDMWLGSHMKLFDIWGMDAHRLARMTKITASEGEPCYFTLQINIRTVQSTTGGFLRDDPQRQPRGQQELVLAPSRIRRSALLCSFTILSLATFAHATVPTALGTATPVDEIRKIIGIILGIMTIILGFMTIIGGIFDFVHRLLGKLNVRREIVIHSFLDGVTAAGLFGWLRRPGAPMELIDSRNPEGYELSAESRDYVWRYEHDPELSRDRQRRHRSYQPAKERAHQRP